MECQRAHAGGLIRRALERCAREVEIVVGHAHKRDPPAERDTFEDVDRALDVVVGASSSGRRRSLVAVGPSPSK